MAQTGASSRDNRSDWRQSAEQAGLRYVEQHDGWLCRRPAGDGFDYVTARGRRVRDASTLRRIRSLAIPPAWRDVRICPLPHGHLQAVGRDARGRKRPRSVSWPSG